MTQGTVRLKGLTGVDSFDEDGIFFGSPFRVLVQPAITQNSGHRWRIVEEVEGGWGDLEGWEAGEGIRSRATRGYLCVV